MVHGRTGALRCVVVFFFLLRVVRRTGIDWITPSGSGKHSSGGCPRAPHADARGKLNHLVSQRFPGSAQAGPRIRRYDTRPQRQPWHAATDPL